MSFRDSPMADTLSASDIFLNRHNVALARSQRLIQSWLPLQAEESAATVGQPQQDEEDDFDGMSELVGVGSKRKAEDDGGILQGLKKRRTGADDRLLEQLLGKKGAQMKKKAQEASRAPAHAAAKPLAVQIKSAEKVEQSDEEEEGRATAFKSRKQRPIEVPPVPKGNADAENDVKAGDDEEDGRDQPLDASDATSAPTSKRKASSYLDELLGQKAAKQKKSKKKKQQPQTAES